MCVCVQYMDSFTVEHISNGTESDVAQYLWSLRVSLLFFLARLFSSFDIGVRIRCVFFFSHPIDKRDRV